jgi:DNA-binding beta-propeller fold protein YncE
MLFPFLDGVIENAKMQGILNDAPLHFEAAKPTNPPGSLRYPGKVVVQGKRIAIADSGNNRVLAGTLASPFIANIETVSKEGLNHPQGMAFDGDRLYVADTENHSIRAIDVSTGELRTIAGTGNQMRTRSDKQQGAMSSPWDVVLDETTLYVAMAGIHQLWSVNLESGASRVHAGTGGEDIRDGDNQGALLAQPMGITKIDNRLYFADAESNGVRWSETSELGQVGTIVGTGLFDFGDVDGRGDEVRLQHPQGIAPHPEGGLLVADSYNDCIKKIDPAARSSEAWIRGLNEPEGISCSGTHAYVADTNAHRIAVIDLKTKEVSELKLE